MGIPWQYGPNQVDIEAGVSSLVQLNVPYRGTLRTLNISAEDGTTGTFEIYNSEAAGLAAVRNANGSSESMAATDIAPHNYIIHGGSLIAGESRENDLNIPYQSADGGPSDRPRRLWMRLTPAGSGELSFVISMLIDTPEF